jgi:hypothetical protein
MGLDMYLNKKIYVGNKWRKPSKRIKITIPANQDGVFSPVKRIDEKHISEIVEETAYWRKANAIHEWFVQNVQGGVDDCREYYVSKENLQELLDTINRVLKASKLVSGNITNGYTYKNGERTPILEKGKYIKDPSVAQELLPTQSGFFFGSTDYDQHYIADLKYTKKRLEEILKEDGDYYYQSSW